VHFWQAMPPPRPPLSERTRASPDGYLYAMSNVRETAWAAVHEALPARWQVGPVSYDPGVRLWGLTARGPHPGRGKTPTTVSGTGVDEVAALSDLDDRLRGVPKPNGTQMDELRRRIRLAYLEGAEDEWRRSEGRQLTAEEQERVLRQYPGDP
jgi:hypothetical protein